MKTHQMTSTDEYKIWTDIKTRCYNENRSSWKYYKDIEMCDEWKDDFISFYRDMGDRPSKRHSIDRIDNTKGYYKENSRWVTQREQIRNRSNTRMVTFKGERMPLAEACEITGMKLGTVARRIRMGEPDDVALTRPLSSGKAFKDLPKETKEKIYKLIK